MSVQRKGAAGESKLVLYKYAVCGYNTISYYVKK